MQRKPVSGFKTAQVSMEESGHETMPEPPALQELKARSSFVLLTNIIQWPKRTELSEANLDQANLSEADLHKADLSEADLIRTDLSGANLNWTNLSETKLSTADLSETIYNRQTEWPEGFNARAHGAILVQKPQ